MDGSRVLELYCFGLFMGEVFSEMTTDPTEGINAMLLDPLSTCYFGAKVGYGASVRKTGTYSSFWSSTVSCSTESRWTVSMRCFEFW